MSSVHLYEQAIALTEAGKPFVLAAVVAATGSTPQRAGANAIIEPTGKIHGTLGSGCLEAESRQRALRALDEGEPAVFDLKLDEVTGWDDGLICGACADLRGPQSEHQCPGLPIGAGSPIRPRIRSPGLR